ncbi:hypothetical protein [Mycolicibacterium frederiksbergense]|uniref:Uncharacterized protein n=1 Tax=Mycolicibacterium frederiksbergense TaxID=117567 RepID=A0A6H0RY49_9MYCO|nr:hypothetical protein [Mycolicibacterium frederiksbergense]QIV79890.1 hypothetical protein EXE63_02475 [Mycolicibacterium frederiksbergense]
MTHTRPTPAGSAFAPLHVTRSATTFQTWWSAVTVGTDATDIADGILALRTPHTSDVESSLHWLMLAVFQGPVPVTWLEVDGLHPTAQVSHVVLDADVAHDSDGDVVGVDVVLSLHVSAADGSVVATTPSAYVQSPATVFATTSTQPADALAEIIDTALDLVNDTITAADHFAALARAPRTEPTHAAALEEPDEPEEPEIEHCRDCGRVTRIDDDPVDTDAADGWNGYCGGCADRREDQDRDDTDA